MKITIQKEDKKSVDTKNNKGEDRKPSEILDNYERDGQMSVYDFPECLPGSEIEERKE